MYVEEAFPGDAQAQSLAEAVASGDVSRVQELVRQGADPNTRGDRGVNLLEWSVLRQSPAGLEALLAAGASPSHPGLGDGTVIHMAAKTDDPRYLEILLAHGADPNTPHGETGEPPLSAATGQRTDAQFRMLLAAGADPNRADRVGNTPLHVAASINAFTHVHRLLEAGADPQARNARGATFQSYLRMANEELLHDQARAELAAIDAWLRDHGVPIEDEREGKP